MRIRKLVLSGIFGAQLIVVPAVSAGPFTSQSSQCPQCVRPPQPYTPPRGPAQAPANQVPGPNRQAGFAAPQMAGPAVSPAQPRLMTPPGPGAQPQLLHVAPVPGPTNVSVSTAIPVISVETMGPAEINVGKTATYTITVRNTGDTPVLGAVVQATMPETAELAKAQPQPEMLKNALQFQLGDLPAGGQKQLVLDIVPRKRGPIDLGTKVRFTAATQSAIQVRQPELAVTCTAPAEALYGELITFKLTITNTGDAPAEDVLVTQVVPNEAAAGPVVPASIGMLAPGQSEHIELHANARPAGTLRSSILVTANGDLEAKAAADVTVRRPLLEVKTEGPALRYANGIGEYGIRVSNPGDAPATQVAVTTVVPAGLRVTAADMRASFDQKRNTLSWALPKIDPGVTELLRFQALAAEEGIQKHVVTATAERNLTVETTHVTRVAAVADLIMMVNDTPGPIEVGAPAEFEIHIKNRGTKAAQNVLVSSMLADALEAVPASDYRAQGRHLAFAPIHEILPGAERVLRFKAVGRAAGDLGVRVTCTSNSSSREIVADESVMFYSDDVVQAQATQPRPAGR